MTIFLARYTTKAYRYVRGVFMKKSQELLSLVCALTFLLLPSCGQTENLPTLPSFDERSFAMSGFWAPYEMSEESLHLYKDSGMTTLAQSK